MSERKAINKYYPPDYDPSKVPKSKTKKRNVIKIRMMLPFSMRCLKCNEYISMHRKFNARKETTNEKYLNIKIIRFHIMCPICNSSIVFKTHPQSGGYKMESGAVKNFESKKSKEQAIPQAETQEEILERLLKEEEENKEFQELKEKRKRNPFWQKNEALNNDGDVAANLEKRLEEQQRQQEINDHLEYLQSKNAKLQAKGTTDELIEKAKAKLINNNTNDDNDDNDDNDEYEYNQVKEATALVVEGAKELTKESNITEVRPAQKPLILKKKTVAAKPAATPSLNLGYSSSDDE